MKTKVFLVLSLLVNLAYFGNSLRNQKAPVEPVGVHVQAKPTTQAVVVVASEPVKRSESAPFNWQQVESTDYKTYIANLRAIGCPELTIQEIIIADIDKLYAPKIRAARINPAEPLHYWDSKTVKANLAEAESRLKLIDIRKEKNELIYELLHVTLPVYGENEMPLYGLDPEKVLATVPEDKRSQVASITQKYDTIGQEMFNKGLYTPEDHKRLNDVRKKLIAELEQTLGVEGARDYYAKTSWLGRDLRNQLVGFDATEAEFRAIHDSKDRLDLNYGNLSHYEPGDTQGRTEFRNAAAETEAKIEAALGKDRYSDYKRSYDGTFQSLLRLVNNDEIPDGAKIANNVYAIKSDALQKRQQIMMDKTMTPTQRGLAMEQIRTEVEGKVKRSMPSELYKKYQPQAGSWINQLSSGGFGVTRIQ
ncbi:MAG: hypothetical protein JWN25_2118 [Verrucomicrobiales bacterium]|nr:hypothetical protein [Verrucomicrobiales bacterium]